MKRLIAFLASLAIAFSASAATLNPVQLLNPAGSSSGQAIVSTGASSAPAWGGIGVNGIAAIAANTVLANVTASSAAPTAFAMPSCSTATSVLQYTTSTGFTCLTAGTAISASTGTNGHFLPFLDGTNTWTGAQGFAGVIIPTSTVGIRGTTTNDNPAAGNWGELANANNTAVSLSANTPTNCTSKSLTAGQWLVWGVVFFSATGVPNQLVAGISTTSATLGATGTYQSIATTSFSSGANQAIIAPPQPLQLASTTTIFLIGQAGITSGTMTCNGYINAFRMR
jgi:hypothetical protein